MFRFVHAHKFTLSLASQNAIDRDQKAMEDQLNLLTQAGFDKGKKIYEQGGNSKSFAVLTLSVALGVDAKNGTVVTGASTNGTVVSGKVYEDYVASSKILKVQYPTSDDQKTYSQCQVGGLVTTNTVGCESCVCFVRLVLVVLADTLSTLQLSGFAAAGSITVGSKVAAYSYNIATDNQNGRTLQSFSQKADKEMRDRQTGNYYPDFQKFFDYYGRFDYADAIATAAFTATSINLNGKTFAFTSFSFNARKGKCS